MQLNPVTISLRKRQRQTGQTEVVIMVRVLVSDPLSEEGLQLLKEKARVDVLTDKDEKELLGLISNYDALIVRSGTQVNSALIEAGKNLKVIGRAGVGVDNIDVDKATEKGIMVINAPEGNTISAAEHTMALLASLVRNIPAAHRSIKEGKWERKLFTGVELHQKKMGLLGMGRIGSEVARRARAMNMQVLAYDPYISPERAQKTGVELVSREELFKEADFISLHLPLVSSTYHIIGEKELEMIKPGASLINCARGGLVNEEALYYALKEGRLAGAALDVFEDEPPRESPLLELDNVVLTPHLGASTEEAQVHVAVQVADQVLRALQGDHVVTAVNVPTLLPEVLSEVEHFLPLMRMMGSFYMQLYGGAVEKVEIHYSGEIAEKPVTPLTTSCLIGMLQVITGEQVNFVNASHIAGSRGIHVKETLSSSVENFANLITLTVTGEGESKVLAGTLFGEKDMRIVQIGDYRIEVVPSRYILVCTYVDRPGVIGRVGILLGDNGINIASMQVGRQSIGGEAVMVLQVDDPVSSELMQEVSRLDGIVDTNFVELQEKDLQDPMRK